jgi:hypothetical protein
VNTMCRMFLGLIVLGVCCGQGKAQRIEIHPIPEGVRPIQDGEGGTQMRQTQPIQEEKYETRAFPVRPIQIVSCASLPSDLTAEVRPCGYEDGFQIYYLVEGDSIAGFDSLSIDSVKTPEGGDVSKEKSGTATYRAGPFPKISVDGKYCVFSLVVPRNQFGNVEKLAVRGRVTLLVGTKREERRATLAIDDQSEKKIGPFTVQDHSEISRWRYRSDA